MNRKERRRLERGRDKGRRRLGGGWKCLHCGRNLVIRVDTGPVLRRGSATLPDHESARRPFVFCPSLSRRRRSYHPESCLKRWFAANKEKT